MNYPFSPSLEHMAAVKIALRLYCDKDIERMMEAEEHLPKRVCCFDRERIELWKRIEKTAAEKLPSLPHYLKNKVSKFLRPFQTETVEWSRDHDGLTGWHPDYKSILCWKADGTIDRMQTAKRFCQNINIDLETRFALACTYFLEDEVLAFWHGNEELRSTRNGKNAAVRFWMKLLKEGSWRKTPWKEMVERYFKISRFRRSDIRLRVGSFFPYLSWESKKIYFVSLVERADRGHYDDFRQCMQAMDATQRMELLSSYPSTALFDCLDWPCQSLFFEMADRLWSYMDVRRFEGLLHSIMVFYIFQGYEDFDYARLCREFWHQSPASFKKAVREDKEFFKLIELTLNYDEQNSPLSLPETMTEFLRQLLGCNCA